MSRPRRRLTVEFTFRDKLPFFKLFYSFLKKYGLFHRLYTTRGRNVPSHKKLGRSSYTDITDFWLDWSTYIIHKTQEDATNTTTEEYRRKLQLSQLWRFYLLDNFDSLDFVDDIAKENLSYSLTESIRRNGDRGSEEVKEYFKKYKNLLVND